METALRALDQAHAELACVDLDQLSIDDLGSFAIGLGRGIDRLTALHAKVIHAADQRKAWAASGERDVEDWLSNRTGTSRGAAAKRRKLGEALEKSKALDDAVEQGELSAEAAAELHDAITNPPEGSDDADVDDLIDSAKGSRPREARDTADRWRELQSGETAEERSHRRHTKRSLTSRPASDGLVESTLVLPELEHRQVMNAINHAAGRYHADDDRTAAQRMADGLITLAKAYAAGTVTGGREKPTVIVGCTPDTLAGLSDEPGWTDHGDRIPADVIRQLAENAYIRRIVMAGNTIVELGTRVRFATDDQYQALVARDGGCRFRHCTIPAAWCEIDHLIPVEHGGTTDTANMVLWCSYHHHLKHQTGVIVIGDATDLYLQMPDGRRIHCPPKHRTPAAA